MAGRRMFSLRIINSGRFLRMPISSQALYFHLGMHADDDGVVEAYAVLKNIGAAEDDLRVLATKGFIKILNEDLVSYITDWNENNYIRADRKVDSIYRDLLISMNPDVKLIEKTERADTKKKNIVDGQWTDNGQSMDGISKDRLGKDSLINTSKDVLSCSNPKTDIYDEIISYLNQKSGAHFKAKTAATRRHISARLKEGFVLDDFKSVIDAKTTEWLNDKKMRQYIRPETLFGTKFEGYLNEAQRAKPKSKYADALKKMDEDIANRMKDFVDTGEFN